MRSFNPSKDVLTMVLAGGQGQRLYPLTKHRSKPAVPFGGIYRIIDFTLSNCINSKLFRIYLLTQYKSYSLEKHINLGWSYLFRSELNEFLYTVPPQQRLTDNWYSGTADAIFQNIYLLEMNRPKYLLILSGDHIYKMDYMKLIEFHVAKKSELTVGCIKTPIKDARQFGVMRINNEKRIMSFKEKPSKPEPLPGDEDHALCNMGVYVFNTQFLVKVLGMDAKSDTDHDFGKNIIPSLINNNRVFAYSFIDENKKDAQYWRDIGTLDSYYKASMDLVGVDPLFNLYDAEWPIRTYQRQLPPVKTVFGSGIYPGIAERSGIALDSIISGGVIISGGRVEKSIISPRVRINSYSRVENSIIMNDCVIGRNSHIRNAIIDKEVVIPNDYKIGIDPDSDSKYFTVTDNGTVIVPKKSPFIKEIS